MSKKQILHLAEVKTRLAEKYERLCKCASSKPKQRNFRRQAAMFRHQAKMLTIDANR
jgi:Holliday junction resolvase-like predicted endonuclease